MGVNQQMYKSPLTPIPRKDIQDEIETRRSDILLNLKYSIMIKLKLKMNI